MRFRGKGSPASRTIELESTVLSGSRREFKGLWSFSLEQGYCRTSLSKLAGPSWFCLSLGYLGILAAACWLIMGVNVVLGSAWGVNSLMRQRARWHQSSEFSSLAVRGLKTLAGINSMQLLTSCCCPLPAASSCPSPWAAALSPNSEEGADEMSIFHRSSWSLIALLNISWIFSAQWADVQSPPPILFIPRLRYPPKSMLELQTLVISSFCGFLKPAKS